MTVISDYDLNATWGWYDFTMVTAIFLIFLVADTAMFAWWIVRNRRRMRLAGVIKFFIQQRTVPLTIFAGFDRRVPNPIMQEALEEVDDYPNNMSQESIDSIALFKDYRHTMDEYFDAGGGKRKAWPANLPYSFELFKDYRTSQLLTPAYHNLSFEQWVETVRKTGQDRRDLGIISASSSIMQQQQQQGSQYPPALGGGGATSFQAFPSANGAPMFDPQTALLTRNYV